MFACCRGGKPPNLKVRGSPRGVFGAGVWSCALFMSHSSELANRAWSAGSTAARPTKTTKNNKMKRYDDMEKTTQEGPHLRESLPTGAPVGCPTYSGGGASHQTSYGRKVLDLVMKKSAEKKDKEEKDSDDDSSCTSMISVSSHSPERRKRHRSSRRSDDEEHLSSGSGSDAPAAKIVAVKEKRGRGRPPTTGHYVGLAKAKAALVAAQREEMELRAEQEIADQARIKYQTRNSASRLSVSSVEYTDEELTSDLNKRVLDSVANIELVATKSKNLKGTYVRVLKDATAAIKEAIEDLRMRTSTDETKRLQAVNARLQEQVADLRKENVEIRKEMMELHARVAAAALGPSRPTPRAVDPNGDLRQDILREVGGLVNARLEAIQPRLLPEQRIRPPLSQDGRGATDVLEPQPGPSGASDPPDLTQPGPESRKGKKGAGKKSISVVKGSKLKATVTGHDVPQLANLPNESWAHVVKKGKHKKAGKETAPALSQRSQPQTKGTRPQRPAKKDGPKLRVPKSSAVVLTIQPGGVEKGLTYAKALLAAKAKINLSSLGISNLGFRAAVTGGRMLEIPGDTSGEKADSLATKLREILDEREMKISRPMKSAELRLTGLDDSVTPQEVAQIVATSGQCALEAVKVGNVRRNAAGLGTMFVRCPVAAAKRVAEGGRLLVGWVTAQVRILPQKPLRCFRCLEVGHVREQCKSGTDRSTLCYRCGLAGHKAGNCSAEPRCVVCAAAGKPAGHRVGSKVCCPSRKKKARGSRSSVPPTQPETARLPSAEVQGQMEVAS